MESLCFPCHVSLLFDLSRVARGQVMVWEKKGSIFFHGQEKVRELVFINYHESGEIDFRSINQ